MKHTDLIIILDRSGSMSSCAKDMEGGFNQMMRDQAKVEGTCNVTLVQFDGEAIETVYTGKPVASVPELSLVPRGATPLLDAIGKTLAEADTVYAALPAERRPEQVLVLIITDGQENASREWTLEQVKHAIETHQGKGWVFSYLGANVDAFAESSKLGIAWATSAAYHTACSPDVYAVASSSLTSYRAGRGYSAFTGTQRAAMVDASHIIPLGSPFCSCPTDAAGNVIHTSTCSFYHQSA